MRGTAGCHGNDADRDTRFWLRPGCEVRQGAQQSSRSGWGWGQVETRSSYAKNCCFGSVAVAVSGKRDTEQQVGDKAHC